MVSTTTAGVSACKSKVHHAPKVLAPVLGIATIQTQLVYSSITLTCTCL